MDKAVVSFDIDKLAASTYRVTPTNALEEGEYRFFYGGSTLMPT